MAEISTELIDTGLKQVEHVEFIVARRPGFMPLLGARAIHHLVQKNREQLITDFPNVVAGYSESYSAAFSRLRRNRKIARLIVTGETWTGTPLDARICIGMFTAVPGEVSGVQETSNGINVAAWLDGDETGRGYLTRLAPELAAEVPGGTPVWTVARPDNVAATTLLDHIGMSRIGTPESYDIGDNVSNGRQLYVATAGDIAQTARAYADKHYPVYFR